jgi:hypothetical protein
MATERVGKYFDDAKILIAGGSLPKVQAEIRKLTTYLQKHQTESIPEGAKTKLFGTIEAYNRLANTNLSDEGLVDCVSSLLGSYLQLPEGKLVSATHKKKALIWIQELNASSGSSSAPTAVTKQTISSWSLEGVNEDGTITLLNVADSERWQEDYNPRNLSAFIAKILELQGQAEAVIVDIDESTDTIVDVHLQ